MVKRRHMANQPTHFLWLDMEMTGLDEKKDVILEIAIIITDNDFNFVDSYHRIIFQPQDILDNMDEWCKKTHGKSGLTEEVKQGILLPHAETEVCTFVAKYFKERAILCGNSIHQDRKFIDQYMKDFAKLLHYRIVDVSSFKEIFRRKYNMEFKKTKDGHRALDDVEESINELKFYLTKVETPPPANA
jgi:oligoribonuclease